jgi:hypothetical protein
MLGMSDITIRNDWDGTSPFLVYGLVDPRDGELRYIGQSSKAMGRPQEHWNSWSLSLRDCCHRWVGSLVRLGLKPGVVVLGSLDVPEGTPKDRVRESLDDLERDRIAFCRAAGCRLTNMTDGGGGSLGRVVSEETRRRLSESLMGRPSGRTNTGRLPFERVCEFCGSSFVTKRDAARFCTRECSLSRSEIRQLRTDQILAAARRKMIAVRCDNDGKIFLGIREAARNYGLAHASVRRALQKNSSVKGLNFSLATGAQENA